MGVTLSNGLRRVLEDMQFDNMVANLLLNDPLTDDSEINFVSMKGGQLTFLPKAKQDARANEPWLALGRQEAKPAKLARKLLKAELLDFLKDTDLEAFANGIKATDILTTAHFELVQGEQIRYWYNGRRYADDAGTAINSCMRYDKNGPFFDLYVENPNQCRMLVLLDNASGLLKGRALVWRTDCGKTFMDRIYANDVGVEAFRDHAMEQGWHYRAQNTAYNGTEWVYESRGIDVEATITLDRCDFNYYPFMDTWAWLNAGTKKLRNHNRRYTATHTLQSQHGERNRA